MQRRIRNNQYTANTMRRAFRILAAVIALISGGLSGPPAHSCMTLTGAGGACGGGTPPSFSGSGDTVSGAFAYWSCARAYTAAYAAGTGNACDIIRASDSATCTIKFAASGFTDVTTAYCNSNTQNVTAFCNATTCKVTKAYDQSGATNCTTACDATQATDAARPVLNLSGLGSKVCMTYSGAQNLPTPAATAGAAQPYSFSAVSERTGSFTSFQDILGMASGGVQLLYNSVANQGGIFAGTLGAAQAISITDSAYHAIQVALNGASSAVVVDGAATTGLSPGAGALGGSTIEIGADNNFLTGIVCEVRMDTIAYNATQYGNLNTNQHSATSGYNF